MSNPSPTFFSIVIPAYNREGYIEQCLDSVFAQKFNEYEIIVVDDGSTDNTNQILKTYGDQIKLICQKNSGAGVARQKGCAAAKGKYIAFLDSDDLWFPWTLEEYQNIIIKENFPSVLWGSVLGFEGLGHPGKVTKSKTEYELANNFYSLACPCPMVATCNFVVKRDAFESINGFFEYRHLCEDTNLFLDLGLCSGAIYMEAPVMVAHRNTPNSFIKNSKYLYDGLIYIRNKEKTGAYPGGKEWSKSRQKFISMNFRNSVIRLIKRKEYILGWKLYIISLPWQIKYLRFKFLIGAVCIYFKTLFIKNIINEN